MSSFSVFNFHNFNTLEEFRRTLRASERIVRNVNTWTDGETLISEVREVEGFDIDEHVTIQAEDQVIQYLFFEGYTERAKTPEYCVDANGRLKPKEERINLTQANILVFQHENCVKGIVFCGLGKAKTVVRDIFVSEAWGNVIDEVPPFEEDLFYWVFKRYIDSRNDSLSRHMQMYITGLFSYMGKTRDNVNAMRGVGISISDILGTLAFLFQEENSLKAIRPEIQYGNESVLFEMRLTGTYKLWPGRYTGQYFRGLPEQQKINALAIFIIVIIVPKMIESHNENINNNQWSPILKLDFLNRLGGRIVESVQAKMDEMQRIDGLAQLAEGDVEDVDIDELEIDDDIDA